MIGSCTLVVKQKGQYRVHIIGLTLGDPSIGSFKRLDKKHKPEVSNLSDLDAYKILSSCQCFSEFEPNYSEFAGDRQWLLDLDDNKLIDREEFTKRWAKLHVKELVQKQSKFEQKRTIHLKNILKAYERLEKDILLLMETKKHTDLAAIRSYDKPHCRFDSRERRINFFIGHKYSNIRNIEPFYKWFLNRREKLKPIIKSIEFDDKIVVDIYTFVHKNQKWVWNRAWGQEDEVAEFIK
jgi:hypothetical protein